MHAQTLYLLPSPSHHKPPTCSGKEGRFWNEVGWAGGELAHSPLDFPSLSAKIPPNYRITGGPGLCEWGGGRAEAAGSHPHLPSCGARGLEPLWGAPRGCWLCAHKGVNYPAGAGSMQNGAGGHILPTCQAPVGSLCPCLCGAGDGEGRVS